MDLTAARNEYRTIRTEAVTRFPTTFIHSGVFDAKVRREMAYIALRIKNGTWNGAKFSNNEWVNAAQWTLINAEESLREARAAW